jgi:hypothetical protein
LYEPALADSEREAVADLLQYLENVCTASVQHGSFDADSHSEVKQTFSPESLYGP